MSEKYKIRDQNKLYFITFAVVDWIDVFTRQEYRNILLESLRHCQKEKGLEVYAWCIMSNHIHMIVRRVKEEIKIEDIIRDFKKFTSVHLCRAIESNVSESRREWMLNMFAIAATMSKKHVKYMFWQNEYHPIELSSQIMAKQKLDYTHNNPVTAGIVERAEEYLYSSARDYYGSGRGLLDIKFIE
jgi:putative transposase